MHTMPCDLCPKTEHYEERDLWGADTVICEHCNTEYPVTRDFQLAAPKLDGKSSAEKVS